VEDAGPYILEGSNRFDALVHLKKKTFPAMVVESFEKGETQKHLGKLSTSKPVSTGEAIKLSKETSIKNALASADREAFNLSTLSSPERLKFAKGLEDAKKGGFNKNALRTAALARITWAFLFLVIRGIDLLAIEEITFGVNLSKTFAPAKAPTPVASIPPTSPNLKAPGADSLASSNFSLNPGTSLIKGILETMPSRLSAVPPLGFGSGPITGVNCVPWDIPDNAVLSGATGTNPEKNSLSLISDAESVFSVLGVFNLERKNSSSLI